VLLEPQKTQGREGMTRHQRTISIVVFLALFAAALPSAGLANSLLSGYGGPGEGNQAILGSALLNTPKGGGGDGGGASGNGAGGDGAVGGSAGGGRASSSQPGKAVSPRSGRATGAGKAAGGGGSAARTRSSGTIGRGGAGRTSHGGSVIYPAASSEVTTGGSRTLDLSGADFAYIIVALGVLALTGFLTMRLARTTVARGPDGRR
jgi:hypothetical protein